MEPTLTLRLVGQESHCYCFERELTHDGGITFETSAPLNILYLTLQFSLLLERKPILNTAESLVSSLPTVVALINFTLT